MEKRASQWRRVRRRRGSQCGLSGVRFFCMIARKYLGEALEKDRILLRQCVVGIGQNAVGSTPIVESRWPNFVPERVANLQSTKDVNRVGRHSPQAEQDETGSWRSNQQTKGK